ncbi:MAG: hypothetical protein PHT07_13775 [Paludibacter sp.]|nr:hypothetical protein [Paludibacter sp.]
MKTKSFLVLTFVMLMTSVTSYSLPNENTIKTGGNKKLHSVISIHSNVFINNSYIGNGAQWDPYQMNYGKGDLKISDNEWKKLYDRLDFMHPQFIRVMTNTQSAIKDGKLYQELNFDRISHILDYCQTRKVTVVFGDWGNGMVNAKSNTINQANLSFAADYLDFIISKKGYSCVKYYNLINEPNGYWSTTDGNYNLWSRAIQYFHDELGKRGLLEKVSLMGPDVAVWTTNETWWVDSCSIHMKDIIGLYDIHTYPSKITVNSGEYTKLIQAYKKNVPAYKKIIMGEIGFKYIEPADSALKKENIRRENAKPFASKFDSQMHVYDYMYGTDMADALFQTINAGFSGSVAWMLDDAMHGNEAPDKLKIWGFWNIFGDEYFGAEEEIVRPWYYAWSLLTKYIPAGSKVHKVEVTGNPSIKAISIENKNNRTIAFVNVSKVNQMVEIKDTSITKLKGMKQFVYAGGKLIKQGDHFLLPNKRNLTLNLKSGCFVTMNPESLIVYTNYKY